MNNVSIEEKYIFEYIYEMINNLRDNKYEVVDARYHHNTSYYNAESVIKNGILSPHELNRLRIKKYSDRLIEIMDDIDSHVNGKDGISLSVVGLTDIYSNEDEYDPFNVNHVDFVISSDIKVSRRNEHYGNEFIAHTKIDVDMLKTLDIRILKYINQLLIKNVQLDDIRELVSRYNELRKISQLLNKNNLILREMSFEDSSTLDTIKLAQIPILRLK